MAFNIWPPWNYITHKPLHSLTGAFTQSFLHSLSSSISFSSCSFSLSLSFPFSLSLLSLFLVIRRKEGVRNFFFFFLGDFGWLSEELVTEMLLATVVVMETCISLVMLSSVTCSVRSSSCVRSSPSLLCSRAERLSENERKRPFSMRLSSPKPYLIWLSNTSVMICEILWENLYLLFQGSWEVRLTGKRWSRHM